MRISVKKNNKIKILFVLFLGVIFALSSIQKVGAASSSDYSKLKNAIILAYRNYEISVDVRSYGIYNDAKSSKKISDIMEEVINETPELFYTGRKFSKDIAEDTNQIITIHLTYSSAYKKNGKINVSKIKSTKKLIDKATKKALKNINNKMTQVDKAMVLHDYLVKNVSYTNKSSAKYRLTLEGTLVKHKANCQGYSVTYAALLKAVGIEAKCITSSNMNHMWNLVKIGSSWYHVDVTWDDPVHASGKKLKYGYIRHNNFLLSDAAIKKQGHFGFTAAQAKNKKFDKKYWRNVNTIFRYRSGKFVYRKSSKVYMRKHLTSSKIKCINK